MKLSNYFNVWLSDLHSLPSVTPVSYCPSTTLKLSPTPDVDPSQVGSEEGQNYAGIIGGVLAVCVVAILIGMSGLAVALLAGFKYLRR